MTRRVAVTGIGIITPLDNGGGLAEFWRGAASGTDAIRAVTRFDTSGYICKTAGMVQGVPDGAGPPRWHRFLESAFRQAVTDASVDPTEIEGLFLGTVLGGILAAEAAWSSGGAPPEQYQLYSGALALARIFGINGPVTTVSTACASGTDAIGIACRRIMWGKSDVLVAGGSDTLSEFAFSGFNSLKALTRTKARPFDRTRDGLVLGEGACFLVLEEQGRAQKRGASVYGTVLGYSSVSDGRHLTAPERDGGGLAAAITGAMKEAGLHKACYINAHGTGTVYNDAMETRAVKLAFGKDAYSTPMSSIKSMIGHSFGAGGAIEAAACLLAIRDGVMPPTINYTEPDPDCDLDYIPNKARQSTVKTAISLSAGFGGQNSAIVFGRPL